MTGGTKNQIRLATLMLVLVGFALRMYRLDHQALRGDEAFALLFARQPLVEMLPSLATTEPHPPLYYATLHLWISLLGQSEFAARFLSVLIGTLMVPMIYRLGATLCGAKVGWLAGLLGAINPFLVWHNQDVRMYSMLACLGLGSVLLFSLVLEQRSGEKKLWGGYIILTLGALYVHYFSLFILAIENVIFLCLYLFWRRRHLLRRWLVTQTVIAVLYVPWLFYVGKFMLSHTKDWIVPVRLFSFLRRFFVVYSLGTTVSEDQASLLVWTFVVAFLLGCYGLIRLPRERAVILGTYLFLPAAGTWLISLFRPIFDERYLIIVAPVYGIFLALGLGLLFRWVGEEPARLAQSLVSVGAGGFFLALMVASSGYSLSNYFYVPAYAKSPDWRALATTLRQRSAPGDLVIHNYPDPALRYYLQDDLPLVVLPASVPVDPVATAEALARLAAEHQRLWLVPQLSTQWDATGLVERWLDQHCDRVSHEAIGTLSLSLYLTPPTFLSQMTPVNACFGGRVELAGYRLNTDIARPQSGVLTTAPNTALRLTLYWHVLAPVETSYTVFTHLLDANGQLWAQKDNPPVRGSYPTTDWKAGETIVDKYDIVIPPAAPAGQYELEVGLYDATTGERLPLWDRTGQKQGERVLLSDRIVVK